ncbi:MAG: hypothetical protein ABFR97_12010 [Thermodesulfobacteriota bacterium]
MNKLKVNHLIWTVCLAFILAGCAVTGRAKVQPDSFAQGKTYALVSVASSKHFGGEQGMGQLFTKNENIKGINTQPVVDKLVPIVRTKMSKTGYFTSVPMRSIVSSVPYKRVAEDVKIRRVGPFKNEMNPGNGYKYLANKEKLAKLARDLRVDGVICLNMDFTVMAQKSGVHVGPLSFGKKKYETQVAADVMAYDRSGNLIWRDHAIKRAEPGDTKGIIAVDVSEFTGTDFEKLHPTAVQIGSYAVDILVQRFQDTMSGKGTSTFQAVKDKGSKEATQAKLQK